MGSANEADWANVIMLPPRAGLTETGVHWRDFNMHGRLPCSDGRTRDGLKSGSAPNALID
jgi:hypothetical protein